MIHVGARTDTGTVRSHNEDAFLVDGTASWECAGATGLAHAGDDPLLLLVCDGMGGAAAGEVASRLAIETIRDALRAAGPSERSLPKRLECALHAANAVVHDRSTSAVDQHGMGTTATAVLIRGEHAHLGQIGDSRAYLLRGDDLRQITRDQSLVSMLVDAGQITGDEARLHPGRNMLLQALGPRSSLNPAIGTLHLRRGDRLLLCSDGLTGCLDDDEIRSALLASADVEAAAETLIALALARGADDNVTAVLVETGGAGLRAPDAGPVQLEILRVYDAGAGESRPPLWKAWTRRVLSPFRRRAPAHADHV